MTEHTYIDLRTAIDCLQRVDNLLTAGNPQDALYYIRALRDALTEDVLMGEKLREIDRYGPHVACQ